MAFRTNDFKKTTRKAKGDAPALVYPHQMRDKKTRTKLEVAIRMFDALVGRRRGEMDAGSLVDFFGDPRLARGVVACLGQYYRYRAPAFAEVVGRDAANALTYAGLGTPAGVRAHTYAHVNAHHDGFLTEAQRPEVCEELGAAFGLSARDWDALLYLDGEDNQVLTRPGRLPSADDIAALYNFHALDTGLRRAVLVKLMGLELGPSAASDVRAMAGLLGLRAIVSEGGGAVTLTADADAAPSCRRPGHLARATLMLAHGYATKATLGFADVMLGTKRYRLALATDALRTLGAGLMPGEDAPGLRRRLETGDTLHRDLLKRRARGEAEGWRIKRLPEPIVTGEGVVLPDLRLTRDGQSADVLLAPPAPGVWDVPQICLPLSRRAPEACAVLERAEALTLSLFTLPAPVLPPVPADVRSLCDRAAAQGLVRTGEAQRALHLLDESPLIEWVRRAADPRVQYVPGVGLCARDMVDALSAAPAEEVA